MSFVYSLVRRFLVSVPRCLCFYHRIITLIESIAREHAAAVFTAWFTITTKHAHFWMPCSNNSPYFGACQYSFVIFHFCHLVSNPSLNRSAVIIRFHCSAPGQRPASSALGINHLPVFGQYIRLVCKPSGLVRTLRCVHADNRVINPSCAFLNSGA